MALYSSQVVNHNVGMLACWRWHFVVGTFWHSTHRLIEFSDVLCDAIFVDFPSFLRVRKSWHVDIPTWRKIPNNISLACRFGALEQWTLKSNSRSLPSKLTPSSSNMLLHLSRVSMTGCRGFEGKEGALSVFQKMSPQSVWIHERPCSITRPLK